MRDANALRSRDSSARRGAELEADLPAVQRQSQEQARAVPQRDDGTGADFIGLDRSWGFCVVLPQLRLEGSRR